jgi:protein-tyrosine phosphatase
LPDHRQQEILDIDKLSLALTTAEQLVLTSAPVYLHCFAGQERSSLLAVGLTSKFKNIDVFSALEWVRRCHPISSPSYEYLEMLEKILKII